MRDGWRNSTIVWIGWALVAAAGTLLIVRLDIAQRREAFQADARIAHRLLSQRAAQHEAILATLVLLGPQAAGNDRPEARLQGVYPRVLSVQRVDAGRDWPDPALRSAAARSRQLRRAFIGEVDPSAGQFTVVLASEPTSFALRIDALQMVPWEDWPVDRSGPVRAELILDGRTIVLQPGLAGPPPAGLTSGFTFAKTLAATSQPFELRMRRSTGPVQWPWLLITGWLASSGLVVALLVGWRRSLQARRRAEELLRVGRIARLNALGELAGGIAHELNQPLTAVLAGAQAARRLLDDDPPQLDTARQAMGQAAAQARRAAEVVARLRRLVDAPDAAQPRQPVPLGAALRSVLDLLAPQLQQRRIKVSLHADDTVVLADPVALEQIVHNLLGNAMQALDEVAGERRLDLTVQAQAGQGVLIVCDNGPGIAAAVRARLFEPFFTTRSGGLGLGLSLSQSLAQSMAGTLDAMEPGGRGATFRLALPLAHSAR